MDPEGDQPVSAMLAEVVCRWSDLENDGESCTTAAVIHRSDAMLVLEALNAEANLPPLGSLVHVTGEVGTLSGRVAEHGRGGRFLLALGGRPVRQSSRLRVSLPALLRSPELNSPTTVEIVDLTTGGARIRGVELPVGTQVTLDFTPPLREQPVSVRANVAHGTHRGGLPWIGVVFRLVAMRGGR